MIKKISLGLILALPVFWGSMLIAQDCQFGIRDAEGSLVPELSLDKKILITSPPEGLWSVATAWAGDWPAGWVHASPVKKEESGDWQILSGEVPLPQGIWKIRDAYRMENGLVKCIRRFEWTGKQAIDSITLSVRFRVAGSNLQAFLPGILYYGNPSGYKNTPDCVPHYFGQPGEMAIFEDHRYPMPFACLESAGEKKFGAVIHTVPSSLRNPRLFDQWWSMGVAAHEGYSELCLLSGPITYNDKPSVAKALQCGRHSYGDTYISVKPGTIIEKTFYLDLYSIEKQGTAFQKPVHDAIALYKPFYTEDLPTSREILTSKYLLAKARWTEGDGYAGFNMYPWKDNPQIVMGWCGQAESLGYALQILKDELNDDMKIDRMVQQSMDFLASFPVSADGFPVRFDVNKSQYGSMDPVSMGQGMFSIAKAVEAARTGKKHDSAKWEAFLVKACDFAATRILDENWTPRSTAEGFYIAPLCIASNLFGTQRYRIAAVKAADYYASRHLSMKEPYWGGTLDASGEDKEGAWAAFQGFLSVYELTGEKKYLEWARHACDACLSYTVVWDIPLPPGRMADHQFKTRGWTVVSPQNQHIDVFGVFFTPDIYKLGQITGNEDLKRLSLVMFRSCGQLTDPFGSQGEQMQETNFAQAGDMTDVYRLRGGYAEHWTVFWITAHFFNAAARFREMGISLD